MKFSGIFFTFSLTVENIKEFMVFIFRRSYIYKPNFIFIKVKNFKFWWMIWIWVHKNSQKYSINMVIFQSLTNRRNFVWEIFGEKIHWAVDYFRIGQVQSFDSWKSRLDLARPDIYVKVLRPIHTLKNHYLRLRYFFCNNFTNRSKLAVFGHFLIILDASNTLQCQADSESRLWLIKFSKFFKNLIEP